MAQWNLQLRTLLRTGTRCLNLTASLITSFGITGSAAAQCEPGWVPTFGGQPGVNGSVYALTVFDDGSGAGPALYAGGTFSTAGDVSASKIAKWDGSSWSPLGSGLGLGIVFALTVFDDGTGPALYAGGSFYLAGGVPMNGIAKWNGSSWSPLGSGVNTFGSVYALTIFDDGSGAGPALYAGGDFIGASGVTVNRIAKWDGSSWSPLGSGMNNWVGGLAVFDDGSGPALYAGGGFTTAGGATVNRIAKWDGSSWSNVGSGTSDNILDLTVFDDRSGSGPALYAGGFFTIAGGVTANYIAKWNGSSWSAVGSGTSGTVRALTVVDDGSGAGPTLYAGGVFTTAGGETVNRIAKWDGTSWSPVGSGMNDTVWALAVFNDGSRPALYAGGSFSAAAGVTASGIARWDGSSWWPVGGGVSGNVLAMTVFDDGLGTGPALYVGGVFTTASDEAVNRIAKWDGSSWSPLGSGMNGSVHALTVFDDGTGPALYVGGSFTAAAGAVANYIAKWDGSSWSPLDSGMNSIVYALTVFDDGLGAGPALYAGGNFTTAGGVEASHIAKWDGSSWSPLGTGMSGVVFALSVFDDESGLALYAGGTFTNAGGVAANYIAKWDGSFWSPLSSGMSGDFPFVYALAAINPSSGAGPALFAGGRFTTASGATVNRVAKWDGFSWSPMGSGMNNDVHILAVFDDGSGSGPELYAGGAFTTAGGVIARRIAKWDGFSWSPLGSGMLGASSPSVYALTVFDDDSDAGSALYAGGAFPLSPAGDRYLAKWQGCAIKPECAPADLNCDGIVDVLDLLSLLGAWGQCPRQNPCPADLDNSGAVDVLDLLILLQNWGP